MAWITNPRKGHPYNMWDMMQAQPDAVSRVLKEETPNIVQYVNRLASDGIDRIHVVGIGSSWHAALVGEYLIRTIGGFEEVRTWQSFEFNACPPRLSPKAAVIVLSHRGNKRYSLKSLELAKEKGGFTALITGLDSKGKLELADFVFKTSSQEQSATFTVSHTTALLVLTLIALEMGKKANPKEAQVLQEELQKLPEIISSIYKQEDEMKEWAKEVAKASNIYLLGWGPNVSTAYEGAMKIKEANYAITEGFLLEQFLHGSFAAIETTTSLIYMSPHGYGYDRTVEMIKASMAVGGKVSAIVDEDDKVVVEALKDKGIVVKVPKVSQALSPIVYLIPIQMLTYFMSLEKKENPDTCRKHDAKWKVAGDLAPLM